MNRKIAETKDDDRFRPHDKIKQALISEEFLKSAVFPQIVEAKLALEAEQVPCEIKATTKDLGFGYSLIIRPPAGGEIVISFQSSCEQSRKRGRVHPQVFFSVSPGTSTKMEMSEEAAVRRIEAALKKVF